MTNSDNDRLQRALVGWDQGPYMTFLKPSADAIIRAAGIREGHRVLDVGAGFGDPTLDIAALVGSQGSVVGLDHDQESLEIARRRAAERGLTNITFEESDVMSLPFPDRSFDVVISRDVIIYFADPLPFLREQFRILSPGGRVAFSLWGANDRNPLAGVPMPILARHAPPPQEPNHPRPANAPNTRDPAVLETLLKEVGFVERGSGTVGLTSLTDPGQANTYWEQRRAGSPASQRVLVRMSAEQQDAAETEVVEAIRNLIAEGRADGEHAWAAGRKPS